MGVICILVVIGIILQKRGVVDPLTSRKLSTIVVDVCNPAMILASVLGGGVTADRSDLIKAVILGAAFYAVLLLSGLVMPRLLRVEPDKRKFYHLMSVYTNTGFLGIPVAKAILPPNAIIYVVVVNVFYSLLFYTHGQIVFGKGPAEGVEKKSALRGLINPGLIMAIITLVVFWFEIKLPPILVNTVEYVGNATVFLSMMMLGVMIATSKIFGSLKNVRIWVFILIRLIMLPIAFALVLHAFGVDKTAILAICLMAAVPVGNLPLITAEKKGMDTSVLSSSIAMTTAVSIVTITCLIATVSAFL